MSRSPTCTFFSAILLPLAFYAASDVTTADEQLSFKGDVLPVLRQHCFGCHGHEKQEGDVRLDLLNPDMVRGGDTESWHDVLNKLNLGEMPPNSSPQLSSEQLQRITKWMNQEIHRAAKSKRTTGGETVLRRLTRYEYANTIRDLLDINSDVSIDLPPEPNSSDGFKNNGSSLRMSPLQLELYLNSAREALNKAIVPGPRPKVIHHQATKSEKIRRVKGPVSNRLGKNGRFLVRLNKFPRRGPVRVRVKAHAVVPNGASYPTMRVAMGVRADVRAPERTMGTIEVRASKTSSRIFEFEARIEDFPLPGHNPKFPGLQITVYNDTTVPTSPGQNKRPKKKKRNKKKNSKPEDPNQPIIVVESVEFDGPFYREWPPATHAKIFPPRAKEITEEAYATLVLQRFLRRAYRRPTISSDITRLLGFYRKLRPNYESVEETLREVLALALVSPDFLYLVEARPHAQPLNDHELASRLSYFLWSSMPDEELFQLANSGKLHEPNVLAGQVERLLKSPKSREFVNNFTNQWLDLDAMERVAVNPEYHPNFDARLKSDMRRETQLFFAEFLDNDISCLGLIESDFTILNRRLATHYGIKGPTTSKFERVQLSAEDRRGGLLSQGSFLLANSNGEDSHPIRRAVWILDRLLDNPPPPPPPDVPELNPEQANLAGLSLKERLNVHRQKEACNRCHVRIDPWGIALENFDAVGRWRTQTTARKGKRRRKTNKIDATTELAGKRISGPKQLKDYLIAEKKSLFARALVRRLYTYAVGRSVEIVDEPRLKDLTKDFVESDFRLRPLIVAIVQSEAFLTK